MLVLALLASVSAAETPMPSLPGDAVWVMQYDDKLDGKTEGKPGSEVRWRLSVRNDRIGGSLADLKVGDAKDHRLAGEIANGKPPIVVLRQDGPNGLVCYYSGKRIEERRIVGTWFDNRGGSGDFDFRVEVK
jgi:hypothetical protein